MFTDVKTNLTSTYQEGTSVELCLLEGHLRRALRVQVKELIHWFDETQGTPFAECSDTLSSHGCYFCERN